MPWGALFAGIAGILFTSRIANGVPTAGQGYELDAIAAAVIGGASLSGAEGSVFGTIIGAIIMQLLRNGGNLLGVNPFILEIIIGGLIVANSVPGPAQQGRPPVNGFLAAIYRRGMRSGVKGRRGDVCAPFAGISCPCRHTKTANTQTARKQYDHQASQYLCCRQFQHRSDFQGAACW